MQGVELHRILRVSALKEDFELNAYTYKHAKHETALDLRVHDLTDRPAFGRIWNPILNLKCREQWDCHPRGARGCQEETHRLSRQGKRSLDKLWHASKLHVPGHQPLSGCGGRCLRLVASTGPNLRAGGAAQTDILAVEMREPVLTH